jgi:hypothetical protein
MTASTAELPVIGLEQVAPARLARVVQRGRVMTEEINVHRLVGAGAELGELIAQRLAA